MVSQWKRAGGEARARPEVAWCGVVDAGGILPATAPQALGLAAVVMSSVNIVGGFILTSRMLDMFRRPGGPAPSCAHPSCFACWPPPAS